MSKTYEVTDNKTGTIYEIDGDREPTQAEVMKLVADLNPKANALRKAGTLERSAVTGMFDSDEERKAYLEKQGLDPNSDLPLFSGGLPELGKDVLESSWRLGAKTTPWALGEMFGAPGGVAGMVAGGAAGNMAGQAAYEKMGRDVGFQDTEEARMARINAAAGMGAAGTLLGVGVKGALKGVGKGAEWAAKTKGGLAVRLAAKKAWDNVDEWMLTNVTQMKPGMHKYVVEHGWNAVRDLVNKPVPVLAKSIQDDIVTPLKNEKAALGEISNKARQTLYSAKIVPNFRNLPAQTEMLVERFPDLTTEQATALNGLAGKLADITDPTIAHGTQANYIKNVIEPLMKEWDNVKNLSNMINDAKRGTASKAVSTLASGEAIETAYKEFEKAIYQTAKDQYPDFAKAMAESHGINNLIGELEKRIRGPNSDEALADFMQSKLFEDLVAGDEYAKDALANVFKKLPDVNGMKADNWFKSLASAIWMKGPKSMTSGFKAQIPAMAAGALGAGTAIAGGKDRRDIAARAGLWGGAALTLTAPYYTPAWASSTHALMERAGPAISNAVKTGALKAAGIMPKIRPTDTKRLVDSLTKPMGDAISYLRSQFDLKVTEEDTKKLK